MTKIYLIRHAEAEGNLYRMAHGHYNGMVTNYRGYQQIDALRQRFQDVDIDAVYASDLYRTQITSRAIWLPKALPLHLEPAFREIHMGVWENHTWHELNKAYPQEMYHFNRRVDLWHVEDGETAQDVLDRYLPALHRVGAATTAAPWRCSPTARPCASCWAHCRASPCPGSARRPMVTTPPSPC